MVDAAQLIKDYVAAVLKYEVSDDDADYEACEAIWLDMVLFAQENK